VEFAGSGGGHGPTRERELNAAARVFGIPECDVHTKDIPELPVCSRLCCSMFDNQNSADLQDSMTASWNPQLVKGVISTAVAEVHPDVVRAVASRYPLKGMYALHVHPKVVTFDNEGISGHCNHIAVHDGVALFTEQSTSIPCYQLRTVPIWRKFISVLDVFPTIFLIATTFVWKRITGRPTNFSRWPAQMLLLNANPALSDAAMKAHASQYLWFRKLFVYFSRYGFLNTLHRIR
jgi:LmbE family N-acetylglucosaminyl deacetylase